MNPNPSPHHKTMHLTINAGNQGESNLIWSHYEGFPFTSYKIYRGTHPDTMALIDSIQSNLNSYTDINPPSGNIFYQVVGPDTRHLLSIHHQACDQQRALQLSACQTLKDYDVNGAEYLSVSPPTHEHLTLSDGDYQHFRCVLQALANGKLEYDIDWLDVESDFKERTITVTALSDNTEKRTPALGPSRCLGVMSRT
jgi:hypothetical protein